MWLILRHLISGCLYLINLKSVINFHEWNKQHKWWSFLVLTLCRICLLWCFGGTCCLLNHILSPFSWRRQVLLKCQNRPIYPAWCRNTKDHHFRNPPSVKIWELKCVTLWDWYFPLLTILHVVQCIIMNYMISVVHDFYK